MIELAAVIGIIAGWIFHVAYISPAIEKLRKRIISLEKENKAISTDANDYWIRLQIMKSLAKGLSGLPYANK